MDEPSAWDTSVGGLRKYWWVVVLVTIAGAGAGLAYGYARDPVYTAEAVLSVGRVDVATQAIPGFAIASRLLADTYSRAIVADEVIKKVAKRTKQSEAEVLEHLSATPVPETATVRLISESDSRRLAIREANVGAAALTQYVHDLNRNNPDSAEFLKRYKRASEIFGAAKEQLAQAGPSAERQSAVVQAKLKLEVIGGLYSRSLAGQSSPNTLQLLARAARADDDQASVVQRAGFTGAVAGLLLGSLLAILLYRRRDAA